jgi:hypothetical protein
MNNRKHVVQWVKSKWRLSTWDSCAAKAGYFCSYDPHPDRIVAWNF